MYQKITKNNTKVQWWRSFKSNVINLKGLKFLTATILTVFFGTGTALGQSEDCPPVPAPVTYSSAMCENSATVPVLRSTALNAKWYKTKVDLPNVPTETPIYIGISYQPPMDPMETTTFYVQASDNNGCLSPMVPITMTVVPMPTMTIGDDVNFCIYAGIEVEAQDLVPALTTPSRIDWRLTNDGAFNLPMTTETDGDRYFVTLNNSILPNTGDYTLTAIYHVVTNTSRGLITCSSNPEMIRVTMNPRPNPPIVSSKIICQGTVLEPIQAFGSPNTQWIFESGPTMLPDWIGDNYDFAHFNVKKLNTGNYSFILFDTDAATGCESNRTELSFEVAPAAQTKIVGRTELCAAPSLEELYSIAMAPAEKSTYYWSTSGDVYNYGETYSPNRYVDWHQAGIDTVYVYERTWAGCEGFDTLPVYIAPYPVAHYLWSLSDTSTTIEFIDNSTQASVLSRYDAEIEPIQLEYTMLWNFDHIPTLDKNHVDLEVEYADRKRPIKVDDYTYGVKYPVLTVTNEFGCANSYSTEITITTSSTGIDDVVANQFQIFPNPAKSELFIKSDLHIEKVEIVNFAGRTVETHGCASLQNGCASLQNGCAPLQNGTVTINISTLPQGVYMVKIYSDNGVVISKIVKE